MSDRAETRCREEIEEIERHKYFLSERAGHDVGWEAAEEDWETHHAVTWRADRQRSSGPVSDNGALSAPACEAAAPKPAPAPSSCSTPTETAQANGAETDSACNAATAGSATEPQTTVDAPNKVKKPSWFQRLFSRNYTIL